jgi:hypothetical protein
MYDREGDLKLFSKAMLKFLYFTERTIGPGIRVSFEFVCLLDHKNANHQC